MEAGSEEAEVLIQRLVVFLSSYSPCFLWVVVSPEMSLALLVNVDIHPSIHPSTSPSINFHSSVLVAGASSQKQRGTKTRPGTRPHFSRRTQRAISRPFKNLSSVSLVCLKTFSDIGHAQKTSPGSRPGGILTRCRNYLNWLLSMWSSSNSTLL